jgi:hypothetical protein
MPCGNPRRRMHNKSISYKMGNHAFLSLEDKE